MTAEVQTPGMRADLVAYLRQLSDPAYQQTHWASSAKSKTSLAPMIDFFFGSQELDQTPERAVGLYLFPQDVAPVKAAAKAFYDVVDDLNDLYDAEGAMRHARWPEAVKAAAAAVAVLEREGREA
jgi:hypothetical protein